MSTLLFVAQFIGHQLESPGLCVIAQAGINPADFLMVFGCMLWVLLNQRKIKFQNLC
jgi:hypothetical protein